MLKTEPQREIPDPANDREAFSGPQANAWREANLKEINQLLDRQSWDLVPPDQIPPATRILGVRFVRVVKWIPNPDSDYTHIAEGKPGARAEQSQDFVVDKFKSRLVVQGFGLRQGIDYGKSFSQNMSAEDNRTLSCLAAWYNLYLQTGDIKGFYLRGKLEGKDVAYWRQAKGYEVEGKEDWVCRGRNSVYRLPQSGTLAQKALTEVLTIKDKFKQGATGPMVFAKHSPKPAGDSILVVGYFVDDSKFLTNDLTEIPKMKKLLDANGLELTINADPKKFQGVQVEIDRKAGTVTHHQENNVLALIEQLRLRECIPRDNLMNANYELRCPQGQKEVGREKQARKFG